MTGLDKILEQIRQTSLEACSEIESETERQTGAILAQAQQQAQKEAESIDKKAKAQCADIISRGDSAAELVQRQTILSAKQQVIETMLKQAVVSIKNLPEAEYFELILKMIQKYATGQAGQIAFGAKDNARLPAGFRDEIGKITEGKLTVSGTPCNIDGGFILIYGGIEENCSFDAIFKSEYESLSDTVSGLLFS